MKRFIKEYLKVISYAALGLIFIVASFYLVMNYYHYEELKRPLYISSGDVNYLNYQEKLNEIFDTDEGARYVGEFSFGLNPEIREPMGDILYDEKIIGSIHFTPGSAYQDAFNGNKSSIHWDMVLIQRPEYGGGEIYFDNVLIRKDGKFLLDELKPLNYENKDWSHFRVTFFLYENNEITICFWQFVIKRLQKKFCRAILGIENRC